jgi:hypothetical protein
LTIDRDGIIYRVSERGGCPGRYAKVPTGP